MGRRRRPPRAPQLRRIEVSEGERVTAYRIVPTDDRDDPLFLDSLRSRAARGLPPRRYTPEAGDPSINDGISMFRTFEAAVEAARATAARGVDFGAYVARIDLPEGTSYAEWGASGHLTVWGDPVNFRDAAVDIVPIEGAT